MLILGRTVSRFVPNVAPEELKGAPYLFQDIRCTNRLETGCLSRPVVKLTHIQTIDDGSHYACLLTILDAVRCDGISPDHGDGEEHHLEADEKSTDACGNVVS